MFKSRHLIIPLLSFLLLATHRVSADHPADLGLYHTYEETRQTLQGLVDAHPTRAKLISIGTGWEVIEEFTRREIWALKITDNVEVDEGEPEIVFVGCHHACEWISVEVPIAIAHYLLDNYTTDPSIKEIIDNKVVWVIPMLNPDGHTYCAKTDRTWRKNRRDNGDGTFGVDLNRNYGYKYRHPGGSSDSTNSDLYHGPGSFSEPETQAMRDFLRPRGNVRAVVSYHSFTQAVLRPWSYTLNFTPGEPPPPGELMLKDLSDELRTRIGSVHGESYKDCLYQADREVSGACEAPHYESSGTMTDWVYHEFNIPIFTIELRPRTTFQWPYSHNAPGFELPEAEIAPTIEENVPAALALIRYAQPGALLVRDYVGDNGTEPSSTWTDTGWDPVFWLSPDIRSDPPAPRQGETATITATVHNASSGPVTGVTVQIYYADPSITLEFPNPDAVLLGEGTVDLPANGSAEYSVSWSVPSGPNEVGDDHWCVGLVVKHPDDLPLSTQAVHSNNVAFRNFWPIATVRNSQLLRFMAQNYSTINADLDIRVTTNGLPAGWRIMLDPARPTVLAPGERYLGYAQVFIAQGAAAGEGYVTIHGALTPQRPGAVTLAGSGGTYFVEYRPESCTHHWHHRHGRRRPLFRLRYRATRRR